VLHLAGEPIRTFFAAGGVRFDKRTRLKRVNNGSNGEILEEKQLLVLSTHLNSDRRSVSLLSP